MQLFPQGKTPAVYYFRLFLEEFYADFDIGERVCLVTNSNVSNLTIPGYKIYATGVNEAVTYNRNIQSNPTYYTSVPKSIITDDIILSRQLIGTPFRLEAQYVNPVVQSYPIMTGVVGAITSDDFSSKLELVSESEKLKTQGILKVSQDCMNTLGIGKCTFPNPTLTARVVSVVDRNQINLVSGILPSFASNEEYEVIVGTTSYLVNKSLSTTSSLRIVGSLAGKPQFIKFKRHCNQSLEQCGKYGRLNQFNGNPFLTSGNINIII